MLETGCWRLDAGYWMLDTGYWILDAVYWIGAHECIEPNWPASSDRFYQ